MVGCAAVMAGYSVGAESNGMACSIGLCNCSRKKANRLKGRNSFLEDVIWESASTIDRSFVKYKNPSSSPGNFCRLSMPDGQINLTVVIPTSDASRGGYFPKLIKQIQEQQYNGYEVIIVKADPRQGRAINIGAALAKGKYLITLDDDSSIPDPETFGRLVSVMDIHEGIGIAGGNNTIPDNATPFIKRAMQEIPRRSWKPVQTITDSDLAEHPCMIMRTAEFKRLGGENEHIPRGLDPYLREEFRKLGKRIVVVPGVIYHHLPPDNLGNLLHQFYRNGRQAAYTNRNYPQWVIETPSKPGPFKAHMPFSLRILRFPVGLLRSLMTGKFVWFLCEVAYALGFTYEWFFAKESHEQST